MNDVFREDSGADFGVHRTFVESDVDRLRASGTPRCDPRASERMVASMAWVVSVKGVLRDDDGRLLLGKNERGEWELIGGRLEPGEQPQETLEREFLEESGLRVQAGPLLDAYVFEPVPGRPVLILAYGCRLISGELALSPEHSELAFHDRPLADDLPLPIGYRRVASGWSG